jgi:Spy/CpxP family protein refolding chaperone
MRRLAFWGLLVASLSANLAMGGVALLRRSPGRPGEPLLFSMVALDPGQRGRISALRERLMSTREEQGRRMATLRRELASAVARQPADPAAIDRALRDIAQAQAAYQQAVVEHFLAVRDVLRPEQRPAFEKMVLEHMGTDGGQPHQIWPMPPGEAGR